MALAADPTTAELKAQIDALQKKVETLESKQISTADVDATVQRVLNDAQKRSQLMKSDGFTAGYTADRGFILQDAKGDFLLHPYVQFQLRDSSNWRASSKSGNGNTDFENGFEIRRLKVGVDGNAYGNALTYQFQWATNRGDTGTTAGTGGVPVLEDAWAKYRFTELMAAQGGQFKDPLFRESLVSSTKQLAADRSLQNAILEGNDNYIQGVSLLYGDKSPLHIQGAFTDGFAGSNANFQDPQGGDPVDAGYVANGNKKYNFGLAARAEYMALGDPAKTWKRYSSFSAQGAKEDSDMLILGSAGEWDQAGDANTFWYTADAQWQPQAITGLSVFGAFVGRYNQIDATELDAQRGSANDWGFLAQAGYMVTSRIEPFVRYDYTRVNQDILTSKQANAYGTRNVHEITGGVNYYIHGQNAKITLDLTFLPNGSPIAAGGQDILAQNKEKDQWLARVQFQLVL